ncbi:N-acetylglucosaminyl phosphatidylinositol deacetylase [Candidatus Magnetomorum sp. HK-1]|nr:N-acetylglucosaminyl phosphatidylinositol deacetylase [Candidatus Magnetomorum sp. HK-1]
MIEEKKLIPYKVSPLPPSPWLVISPHPDDETFGMGGTLLLAKQSQIEIYLLVLTNGEQGGKNEPEELIKLRKKELQKVTSFLGIKKVIFQNLSDRKIIITKSIVEQIEAVINELSPACVFFPSPFELHPDHRSSAILTWEALRDSGFTGKAYSYEITVQSQINILIDITAVAEEKKRIMGYYESQVSENNYIEIVEALNTARSLTLPDHIKRAEGFYLYDNDFEKDLSSHTINCLQIYWQSSKQDKLPLVSVMIRTKDRLALLQEAIESVACQTYQNIELIVVNAGGEDVSDLINVFNKIIPQNKCIQLEQNQGRAAAANVCLDNASGDYLIFLDDDDLFAPDHISKLVNSLRKNKNYKAAYTDVLEIGIRPEHLFDHPYDPISLMVENYIPIHAIMFDKSLLKKGCRFEQELDIFEDWDFLLQLSYFTSFLHIKGVSATYRNFGDSGSIHENEQSIQAKSILFEKWRKRWTGTDILHCFNFLSDKMNNFEKMDENKNRQIEQLLHTKWEQDQALASKEKEFEELKQKLDMQTEALQSKSNELKKLNYIIRDQKHHINLLYQSWSWKISAPLRYIFDKIFSVFLKKKNCKQDSERVLPETVKQLSNDGHKTIDGKLIPPTGFVLPECIDRYEA